MYVCMYVDVCVMYVCMYICVCAYVCICVCVYVCSVFPIAASETPHRLRARANETEPKAPIASDVGATVMMRAQF